MKQIDTLSITHAEALHEALGPEYAALRDTLVGKLAVHGASFEELRKEDERSLLHNSLIGNFTKLLPAQIPTYKRKQTENLGFISESHFESDDELEVQNLLQSVAWIKDNVKLLTQKKGKDGIVQRKGAYFSHRLPFYVVGHSMKYGTLLTPAHIASIPNEPPRGKNNTIFSGKAVNNKNERITMYQPWRTYSLAHMSWWRSGQISARKTRKFGELLELQQARKLDPATTKAIYDRESHRGIVDESMPGALHINRYDLDGFSDTVLSKQQDRVSTEQMQLGQVMPRLGIMAVQFNVGKEYIALLKEAVELIEST